VEPIVMSAGELESETAGQPGRLIRERYRKAAELSKTRGKLSCLVINDLDAGIGRFGNTQVRGELTRSAADWGELPAVLCAATGAAGLACVSAPCCWVLGPVKQAPAQMTGDGQVACGGHLACPALATLIQHADLMCKQTTCSLPCPICAVLCAVVVSAAR
jgi:hypothetical protein